MYQTIKRLLIKPIINFQKRLKEYYETFYTRRYMKFLINKSSVKRLTDNEIKEVKSYYKSKGYILKNTYWHRYYKSLNGEFHKEYIPFDVFKPKLIPRLNQQKQWPALLDKNLLYNLFKDYEQPKRVVQNINGFYYIL